MKLKIKGLKIKVCLLITCIAFISMPSVKTNASQMTDLLKIAYNQLGKPYVYGGSGPNSFDCSGFTSYVYKNALGIDIGRTTYDQIDAGVAVSADNLQPGDLIFPHTGHVEMYIGNGLVIHAPKTGDVIKVAPIGNIYSARRIIPESKMEQVVFDANYYCDKYPDLKAVYGNDYASLYNHYVTCGIDEGRSPSIIFDPQYYLMRNGDVNSDYNDNLKEAYNHFVSSGYNEDRPSSQMCNILVYKNRHSELDFNSNIELYKLYKNNPENTAIFYVKFYDKDGNEIGQKQEVEVFKDAEAPEAPKIEGFEFKKWDKDFNNVTSDLDVHGIYEKISEKVATSTIVASSTPDSNLGTNTPSTNTPDKVQEDNKGDNNTGNTSGDDSSITGDNNSAENKNDISTGEDNKSDNGTVTSDNGNVGIVFCSIIFSLMCLLFVKKKIEIKC